MRPKAIRNVASSFRATVPHRAAFSTETSFSSSSLSVSRVTDVPKWAQPRWARRLCVVASHPGDEIIAAFRVDAAAVAPPGESRGAGLKQRRRLASREPELASRRRLCRPSHSSLIHGSDAGKQRWGHQCRRDQRPNRRRARCRRHHPYAAAALWPPSKGWIANKACARLNTPSLRKITVR